MNAKVRFLTLTSGLAIAIALAAWSPGAVGAEEHPAGHAKGMPAQTAQTHMGHITTQAEAEALKPGDSMAMTCSKCKDVMVQKVTNDKSHVKMMTVGEKLTCSGCGGTVEVVATGKGTGKGAEVKHVCSKCGDDAMFCTASKAADKSMKGMKM